LIEYLEANIDIDFKKIEDKRIVNGVIKILKGHRNLIENYNKKALYLLLKEYSSQETPRVSRTVKKIKVIYQKLKDEYYDNSL